MVERKLRMATCAASIALVCGWGTAVAGENALDWLSNRNVEIRKSFTGTSRDAGSPALVSYFNAEDGEDFYAIDIAAKISEFPWDNGPWQGRVYPTVEHHRNSKSLSKLFKTGVGVTAETERSIGRCPLQLQEGSASTVDFCPSLFADLGLSVERDSQNDTTTKKISLVGGLYSAQRPWPGHQFRAHGNELSFRYMPMAGIEYYDRLPIRQTVNGESVVVAPGVDESFWLARINLEYRPYSSRLESRLVLVADYAVRFLIGSSPVVPDTAGLTGLDLTYYLDEKKRIGLSISYRNGEDPDRNFLDEETTSVGLSFKL